MKNTVNTMDLFLDLQYGVVGVGAPGRRTFNIKSRLTAIAKRSLLREVKLMDNIARPIAVVEDDAA